MRIPIPIPNPNSRGSQFCSGLIYIVIPCLGILTSNLFTSFPSLSSSNTVDSQILDPKIEPKMEEAGANHNTASTSNPSWLHVVRGQIQSQNGVNSNSNSNPNCQEQIGGEGIAQNNDMGRLQSRSPSPSQSPPPAELVVGSQPEVWPALGQAPAPPRAPTTSASASTSSSTISIPSSAIQDKRASDVVGHRVSHNVAVSQGSQRNRYVPRGRNAPNRPFFSQGSETNGYMRPRRNLSNRPFFSQGSETNGYVHPGSIAPNRPLFTHGSETNGYMPLWMNAPNRPFFSPNTNITHSMDQVYGGHGYHPNHFYMNVAPMPTYYIPQPMYLDASSGGPYFVPTPPHVPAISQINTDLRKKIVKQANFYFSADNLCKDTYLRGHMDEFGWVSISVVARFKLMRQLTYDVNLILDALRDSTVVELQGGKIRRRNDWFNWPNPDFIVGVQKQRHMDGSSSSETTSEVGTSERVYPERDTPEDVLDLKKDDEVLV